MKKKNILFLISFCLVSIHVKAESPENIIKNQHKKEASYVPGALAEITQLLMVQETENWYHVMKEKRNATRAVDYPSALTQDQVAELNSAIDNLRPISKSKLPNLSTKLLNDILGKIDSAAINMNTAGPYHGLPWDKAGQWRPVVIAFFKHVKALISSFGPDTKRTAMVEKGISPHYFPELKPGETLRGI